MAGPDGNSMADVSEDLPDSFFIVDTLLQSAISFLYYLPLPVQPLISHFVQCLPPPPGQGPESAPFTAAPSGLGIVTSAS